MKMKRSALFVVALLLVVAAHAGVSAHESQPGTLELRQVDKDRYEVIWRAPTYFGQPHPARLELPEHWKTVVEPTVRLLADSQVFRRVVTVGTQGVEGSVLRFPGLENTITDVFVRVNRLDGTTMTAVVRPSKPSAHLRGERTWYTTAGEYTIWITNSVAPPRATPTGFPCIPSCIMPDRNFSAPSTLTEKSTLPRPPLVCSLLSTPTIAVKVAPAAGRRTMILLKA